MRRAPSLLALCMLLTTPTAAGASAAVPAVRVQYVAPAQCPDRSAFDAALEVAMSAPPTRETRITIVIAGGETLQMAMTVQAGPDEIERTLSDTSCAALVESAALVAGLALEELEALETERRRAREPTVSSASFEARIAGELGFGPLPRAHLGGRVGGAAFAGRWSGWLSVGATSTWAESLGGGVEARYFALGGRAYVGYALHENVRSRLVALAGIHAVGIRGRVTGTDDDGAAFVADVGPTLGARYRAWGGAHAAVGIGFDLDVFTIRRPFAISGLGNVHRPRGVSLGWTIAVSTR